MPAFVGVQVDTAAHVLGCEDCGAVLALEVMPDVEDGDAIAALYDAAARLGWEIQIGHGGVDLCRACRVAPEPAAIACDGEAEPC